MKFVVFDIWGRKAHFRPHYATTSPITLPFPPQSTIIGIIGAILGLEREDNYYLEVLQNTKVGVRILSPIKRITVARTVVNTKNQTWLLVESEHHSPRTILNYQYLLDPKYRIYVHDPNSQILEDLVYRLKNGPVFSLYLGTSECLATHRFVGDVEAVPIWNSDFIEVFTPIRIDNVLDKRIDKGKFVIEDVVIKMHPGRKSEYRPVIYSLDLTPIVARVKEAYYIPGDGYITTF